MHPSLHNLPDFNGRVAIVTGAGSGIGRVTSLAFARAGAKVAMADVNTAGLAETLSQFCEIDGIAITVPTDVRVESDVRALVLRTVETFGRLDFAFNNAGIVEGSTNKTADISADLWQRVIDVNLTGVWLCMKYELPEMVRSGGGVIVNTASVAGLTGMGGSAAYVASKHGVIGLTKAAALDYARSGIRVNAVCPAAIKTPMLDASIQANPGSEAYFMDFEPVGRFGAPEEIAAAVLWLCSEAAGFITGHALSVDGGALAGWP
jgi:NAD(P)-dependent dehydrogenase (short-subunit alcohol dehydrogenase family)